MKVVEFNTLLLSAVKNIHLPCVFWVHFVGFILWVFVVEFRSSDCNGYWYTTQGWEYHTFECQGGRQGTPSRVWWYIDCSW
jgi:hypothetical protein